MNELLGYLSHQFRQKLWYPILILSCRPHGLFQCTARNLGLVDSAGVPSLALACLPDEAPSKVKKYICGLLMNPPPSLVGASNREAVRILQGNNWQLCYPALPSLYLSKELLPGMICSEIVLEQRVFSFWYANCTTAPPLLAMRQGNPSSYLPSIVLMSLTSTF